MSTSSISSGLLTTSTALATGRNRINAVCLMTDLTNTASYVIYDNASAASGKVVAKGHLAAGGDMIHSNFSHPVLVENGIYVAITGTNAEVIVYFGG